jgi:hypothetical protein
MLNPARMTEGPMLGIGNSKRFVYSILNCSMHT